MRLSAIKAPMINKNHLFEQLTQIFAYRGEVSNPSYLHPSANIMELVIPFEQVSDSTHGM